jgi:tetratricopeptide (TPR) repeat protein
MAAYRVVTGAHFLSMHFSGSSLSISARVRSWSRAILWSLIAIVFHPPLLLGQAQTPAAGASLQGVIRDSEENPVPAVTVRLQSENGDPALHTTSDARGRYEFSGLKGGLYGLRAEHPVFGSVTLSAIAIASGENKMLDLALSHAEVSPPHPRSAPEFFDQPQFTVAGVTDPTSAGGHGSEAIARNTETLAKATAALSDNSANPVHGASSVDEDAVRQAVKLSPEDFTANYRLGKLLADQGKTKEAIVYLAHAQRLNPTDFGCSYSLALAYIDQADYRDAHSMLESLLTRDDGSRLNKAELHHWSGVIAERSGDPFTAVREYQRAAELDPNETNLFDWGTELLEHRALDPAIAVFSKGKDAFPHSVRMLIGLGVAEYARGAYDDAIDRLCQASDMDPVDPAPYLFLGKIQSVEQNWSSPIAERLARFAALLPDNALANYYDAVSLWKKMEESDELGDSPRVRFLLEKAIRLDPRLAPAHLQLGIVQAEQNQFAAAISSYQKAIEIDPQSSEAHYRLAKAYRKIGDRKKAEAEVQLYQQTSKQTAGELERERREMKEFVFTLRDSPSSSKPE